MLEGPREFFKRHGRLARYAPLVLWIGVIFFMSSGEASASQTSRIIRPILEFFFPHISEPTIELVHAFIRKCAHFTEYGILATVASVAFFKSSKRLLRRYWYAAAFGLVVLVASLDEFNQSFEASRTGSPWDVLLDLCGGLAIIFVFSVFRYSRGRLTRRPDGAPVKS